MIGLAPEEWDFRNLTRQNVEAAALYELCRTHPTIKKELTRTTKSRNAVKSSVRPRRHLSRNDFDSNDWFAAAIGATRGPRLYVAAYFPEFPKPFLSLPATRITSPRLPVVYVVGEGKPFQAYSLKDAPDTATAFTVNFAADKREIIADFVSWLEEGRALVDKRQIKRPFGFAVLKALAAYRLQDKHRYKEVKSFIERLKSETGGDENNVLPWYQNHAGWTTAIATVKTILNDLPQWMPSRIETRRSHKDLKFLKQE